MNQDLLALRRDLRALLAAWRRTVRADRKVMAYCLPRSVSRAYYRGAADATALAIEQLSHVMYSPSEGAPAQHGAPFSIRGRRQ